MIVHFALDPDAVLFPDHDPALQSKFTEDLFRLWRHCGILYLDGRDYSHSALRTRVEALNPALKSRWMKAIIWAYREGLLRPGSSAWSGRLSGTALPMADATLPVDVVAITREFARSLGFSDAELSRPGTPELCRLDGLETASAFQRAANLRDRKLCKTGEYVNSIWNRLFAPLVSYFDPIVVVDRYCLRPLTDGPEGESGIERFLARVDATPGFDRTKRIQVFSTVVRTRDLHDIIRRLHRVVKNLPHNRVGNLELYTVPERQFRKLVHYRYVRFRTHHCLQLDHGIDILEGRTLKQTNPYAFWDYDEVLRKDETALRGWAESNIVFERSNLPSPK